VPETHEGHWRQVTVRVSSRGDVLLLAVIHPQNLTEDQLEAVKVDLREFFETGAGRDCNLTALFFQTFVEKYTAPLSQSITYFNTTNCYADKRA
jgi:tRNA (uracil-5-)-methyltransferase